MSPVLFRGVPENWLAKEVHGMIDFKGFSGKFHQETHRQKKMFSPAMTINRCLRKIRASFCASCSHGNDRPLSVGGAAAAAAAAAAASRRQ